MTNDGEQTRESDSLQSLDQTRDIGAGFYDDRYSAEYSLNRCHVRHEGGVQSPVAPVTTCPTGIPLSVIRPSITSSTLVSSSSSEELEQPYASVGFSRQPTAFYASGHRLPQIGQCFSTAQPFFYYSVHPYVAVAGYGETLTPTTDSNVFLRHPPIFPRIVNNIRTNGEALLRSTTSLSSGSSQSCPSDHDERSDYPPCSEDDDASSDGTIDVISPEPSAHTQSSPMFNETALTTVDDARLSRKSSVTQKPSQETHVSLREMRSFASHFKERRSKLGYTQADVGMELREMFGSEFSQATICRFESLSLSYENLCRWKDKLERWLAVAESRGPGWCAEKALLSRDKPRQRRRTMIGPVEKKALVRFFEAKPRPHKRQIEKLADELELSPQVIRTWIGNYRQKVRRVRWQTCEQLNLSEQ